MALARADTAMLHAPLGAEARGVATADTIIYLLAPANHPVEVQ